MRRTKRDLIVPIHDRRQHRRILTLRNFRNACFVLVALFAGIAIQANLRDRKPHDDFGRLVGRRMESPEALPKRPQVPQLEPIEDQTAADPTLVQAAVRSQILLDGAGQAPSGGLAATPVYPDIRTAEPPVLTTSTNVAIVGGPEGVTLVQRDPRRAVLHGGFGR